LWFSVAVSLFPLGAGVARRASARGPGAGVGGSIVTNK